MWKLLINIGIVLVYALRLLVTNIRYFFHLIVNIMIARKQRKSGQQVTGAKFRILIDLANKSANPLAELESQWSMFEVNGRQFEIKCGRSIDLAKEQVDQTLELTRQNMKSMYEACIWGWDDLSKQKELIHKNAYLLLIHSPEQQKLVAFAHFRFELDEDEHRGVCYCYELQIAQDHQRLGLGGRLMRTMEQIGRHFRMSKVLLTCFNHNQNAMNFYIDKLGYHIDRSSPSKFPGQATFYEILSLKL